MTRNLTAVTRNARHTGAWLFAACEAHDEGREVMWFDARQRALRIAARNAAAA